MCIHAQYMCVPVHMCEYMSMVYPGFSRVWAPKLKLYLFILKIWVLCSNVLRFLFNLRGGGKVTSPPAEHAPIHVHVHQ